MLLSALLARHHRRTRGNHGRRMTLIVNAAVKVVDQVGDRRKGFDLWLRLQPYLVQRRLH